MKRFVSICPKPRSAQDIAFVEQIVDWHLQPWTEAGGGIVVSDRPDLQAVAVLAWDASWPAPKNAIAIDPWMDQGARDTLNRWVASQCLAPDALARSWAQSIDILKIKLAERDICIIGPGPVTGEEDELSTDSFANLLVGTAYQVASIHAAYPPDIIVLADGVGQLSALPSVRAPTKNLRALITDGVHLVVPESLGPLARNVFSDFAERVHVVPMGGANDRLWQTGRSRELGNVLTTLALPVSAALTVNRLAFRGVSLSPSSDFPTRHWTQADDAGLTRLALDVMIEEPASVAPLDTYQLRHFELLRDMLRELAARGVTIPILPESAKEPISYAKRLLSQTILSRLIFTLDRITARKFVLIRGLFILTIFVISAGMLDLSSNWVLLSSLGLLVLALALNFVLLRARVHRWMQIYERRRRQLDARALVLLSQRIDSLESRISSGDKSD